MTGQTILPALLAIGLGALWAFAGYRLFTIALGVFGFLAGFALSSLLVPRLISGGSDLVGVIVGVIAGIVVALLARYLFHLAVTLLAGIVVAWAAAAAATALGAEPSLIPVVTVVGGIAGALLAAMLQAPKWLVVAVTSIGGAAAMVAGGLVLSGRVQSAAFTAGLTGAWEGLRPGPELILLGFDGLQRLLARVVTVPVEILTAEPIHGVAIICLAVLGAFVQARGLGLVPGRRMVTRTA